MGRRRFTMKKIIASILAACFCLLTPSSAQWGPILGGSRASGGGTSTAWITSATGSTRTGDYEIGLSFTVGGSNLSITDLGRQVFSGNSLTHVVSIYSDVFGTPTLVGSATINTSGAAVGFKYTSVTPFTLTAGVTYGLVSMETNAGDAFLEQGGSSVSYTGAATIVKAIYRTAGSTGVFSDGGTSSSQGYVVPNFKYQ